MSDLDPRMTAGIQLLERTGARGFRVAFSPEEDGDPPVWYACATWKRGAEAAAAMDPVTAVMRLCEQVIDGGECTHCGKATIFVPDSDDELLNLMGCVYAYDPELKTYRRGCE